jgi:hypothetical protein
MAALEAARFLVMAVAMVAFVGRERELSALDKLLRAVEFEVGSSRPGRCLFIWFIWGCRRIGIRAWLRRCRPGGGTYGAFTAASTSADVRALTRVHDPWFVVSNLELCRICGEAPCQESGGREAPAQPYGSVYSSVILSKVLPA